MNNALLEMGITVWQQRDGETTATREPTLICVLESEHQDHALLNNILKAVQCAPQDAKILCVNNPAELANQPWSQAPVIVFGEALYPFVPPSAIRSVSLTALSHNISAKKALWQAIQNLR